MGAAEARDASRRRATRFAAAGNRTRDNSTPTTPSRTWSVCGAAARGTVPRAPARVRGAGRRGEDPSMSAVPAGRVLRVRRRHAGAEGRLGLPAARVSRVRPCGRGRRARARKRERGGRGSRVDDAASMRDVSKGVLRRVQRRGGFRGARRAPEGMGNARVPPADGGVRVRAMPAVRHVAADAEREARGGGAGGVTERRGSERRAKSASDSLAERMQGWGSPVGTGIYQVPVWA